MASILSRTARAALKPAGKPVYRVIQRGLHLGYRKPLQGPGAWVVRRYAGNDSYTVHRLAQADDEAPANGVDTLDYAQALTAARGAKAIPAGPIPSPRPWRTISRHSKGRAGRPKPYGMRRGGPMRLFCPRLARLRLPH